MGALTFVNLLFSHLPTFVEPDSDKVWFAGTLAKGQKEGLTKVQSGFTNNYWKDEE